MSENEITVSSRQTVVMGIESAGEHEDVRITVTEGWDGLVSQKIVFRISAYALHNLVKGVLAKTGFPYNTNEEGF